MKIGKILQLQQQFAKPKTFSQNPSHILALNLPTEGQIDYQLKNYANIIKQDQAFNITEMAQKIANDLQNNSKQFDDKELKKEEVHDTFLKISTYYLQSLLASYNQKELEINQEKQPLSNIVIKRAGEFNYGGIKFSSQYNLIYNSYKLINEIKVLSLKDKGNADVQKNQIEIEETKTQTNINSSEKFQELKNQPWQEIIQQKTIFKNFFYHFKKENLELKYLLFNELKNYGAQYSKLKHLLPFHKSLCYFAKIQEWKCEKKPKPYKKNSNNQTDYIIYDIRYKIHDLDGPIILNQQPFVSHQEIFNFLQQCLNQKIIDAATKKSQTQQAQSSDSAQLPQGLYNINSAYTIKYSNYEQDDATQQVPQSELKYSSALNNCLRLDENDRITFIEDTLIVGSDQIDNLREQRQFKFPQTVNVVSSNQATTKEVFNQFTTRVFQQCQVIKDKLFESLHQNITFCYLLSFLYQAIDAYFQCDIPIDLDINNLLIYRDQQYNIKFIYLPKFNHFIQYAKQQQQFYTAKSEQELVKLTQKLKKAYIIEALTLGVPKFFQDLAILLVDFKSIQDTKIDKEELELITQVINCGYINMFQYYDNQIVAKRVIVENIKKTLFLYLIQQRGEKHNELVQLLKEERSCKDSYDQVNKTSLLKKLMEFLTTKNLNMPNSNDGVSILFQEQKSQSQSGNESLYEGKMQDQKLKDQINSVNNIQSAQMLQLACQGRGLTKNIFIEYIESKYCLIVKINFTDLALTIENSDEIIFGSQFFSSFYNNVYIDVDEHRRVTFRTTICIGVHYPVISQVIEAMDICLIAAIVYYEYYIIHIVGNKNTRDFNKFKQLVKEVDFLIKGYQINHRQFFEMLEKGIK